MSAEQREGTANAAIREREKPDDQSIPRHREVPADTTERQRQVSAAAETNSTGFRHFVTETLADVAKTIINLTATALFSMFSDSVRDRMTRGQEGQEGEPDDNLPHPQRRN
jgi:hypothetical protein